MSPYFIPYRAINSVYNKKTIYNRKKCGRQVTDRSSAQPHYKYLLCDL